MLHGSALHSGLLGLLVGGIGMGTGELLAYLLVRVRRSFLPVIISMTVGVIFILLFLEILPESIEMGGSLISITGIGIGYILAKKMDQLSHRVTIITSSPQKDLFLRSGVLIAFAVSLHNFPTGIALGSSLFNDPSIAKDLAITMVVHTIPEGLAIGLPFVLAGMGPVAMITTASIVAVPTAIGAYTGYSFGLIIPWALALLLSVAIGTILYVTYFEILVPAWKDSTPLKGIISLLLGALLGFLYLSLI